MSKRKPPKGRRRGAPASSRSPGARRRKGRAGRGLALLATAVVLLALGVLFGGRLLQRYSTWRAAPAPPAAASQVKPPAKRPAKSSPKSPLKSSAAEKSPAQAAERSQGTPAPGQGGQVENPSESSRDAQLRARVAIVIDDLGRDVATIETLTSIAPAADNVQLSYAVLPFEVHTSAVVEALRRHGAEVLLHLPMDPEGTADPGPGALTTKMSKRELAAATAAALAAVPGAVGVNNHMGSKLSSDRRAMEAILHEVRKEGRYFLDSRTTAGSVGFEVARELGIPAAFRDVFLDDDPARGAIVAQFAHLLATARERGAAIAIAHPRPGTLAVLAEEIPRAAAAGFEFVPVSYLLERSEELPE